MRAFSRVAGKLPWGAGQFRLASRYAARQRWPEGVTAVQQMRSGAKMRLELASRPQVIAFLVRDYSPQHVRYILEKLPIDGTLFDVGANIGLISFAVATRRPDVAIHAFEPHPANVEAWRRNQHLNDAHCARLLEAGASDHAGYLSFWMARHSMSGQSGSEDEIQVPVVTLDQYCADHGLDRIDVLKIDVEGHELTVLRGAERLLTVGAVSTVVCEVNLVGEGAISEFLRPYGFRQVKIPEIGVRRFLGKIVRDRPPGDLAFER